MNKQSKLLIETKNHTESVNLINDLHTKFIKTHKRASKCDLFSSEWGSKKFPAYGVTGLIKDNESERDFNLILELI